MSEPNQTQKELQAACVHAVQVILPTSKYTPWVESKEILDLVIRVTGASKQSVVGALRALVNTGLLKAASRNGTTWWKLSPATKRMLLITAPEVLMPILEKINKVAKEESSQ